MQNSRKSIVEIGTAYFDLLAKNSKLPAGIQEAYSAGKKEVVYAEFYSRKKLAPGLSGIVDFILPADQLLVGVTNLDKGKIPVGVFMACVAIQTNYAFCGNVAWKDQPSAQNYSNNEYFNTIHGKVRNSEFSFRNGNRVIVECLTKSLLSNSAGGYATEANEENAFMLPQPKLIAPDKDIKVQFNIAADSLTVSQTAADNHFIEFLIKGVKLIDRTEG